MRLTLLFVIIFTIHGCGSEFTKPLISNDPEAQTKQLIAEKEFLLAADIYLNLAQLYPSKRVSYQLKAVDSYLKGRDLITAKTVLVGLETTENHDTFFKNLLLAKVSLQNNQPDETLKLLGKTPSTQIPQELLSTYHETKAMTFELQNNFINAVIERIHLAKFLYDPNIKLDNYKQLWDDLNRFNLPVLNQLRSSTPSEISSWIELAIINQSLLLDSELLKQEIAIWSGHYPDHPAIPVITNEIVNLSLHSEIRPNHIALCLPLTGQYNKASQAIRDGFLAAWFASHEFKPSIKIYDTNTLNVLDMYELAISQGADFVVGPLEKQSIGTLVSSDKLTVTTLALNQYDISIIEDNTDASPIPKLIQFGLAPEDEARQVANRGISEGHRRAIVLTPDNEWGERLYKAFLNQWEFNGGRIIEHVRYEFGMKDYSESVRNILNVNSSEYRAYTLRQKLNKNLKTSGRIRQDADMVFLVAIPVSARQIVPQLRFFRAEYTPIYASSHIFTGNINPQLDNDMNGVMFVDAPWVLGKQDAQSSIQKSINTNWSAENSNYRRLYALGVDAFGLIPHIGRLALQRSAYYPGETGDLYITDKGHISRRLIWAKFINGTPKIINQTPQFNLNE